LPEIGVRQNEREVNWYAKLGVEEIPILIKHFFGKKETIDLDYRISTAKATYSDSHDIRWLEISTPRGTLSAPYDLIIDYRNWPEGKSAGSFVLEGKYEIPAELMSHRDKVIEERKKKGKLRKGNNPAPRVKELKISPDGNPIFILERAFYYDQVGTNIIPERPFSSPIEIDGRVCTNVREWDIAQAALIKKLPPFAASRLANTIGVAIGITSTTKSGQKVILRKLRSKDVDVYAGMWHVPFSFALTHSFFEGRIEGTFESLISLDYGHEFSEELGIDFADMERPKLLAFCRDLARAGKPQFFYEMESRLSFEELRKKSIESTREYKGKLEMFQMDTYEKEKKVGYSPEFAAFILLTGNWR
jgi:hypothetical protein